MTTNWRDKWQHRTRGGYEVVNVYMQHGLLRASIKLYGKRHPGYAVDENGTATSHSRKYDLIPITPPAEPVPQSDSTKYEAELAKCADIVQRHHPIGAVKGIGLMEVATGLEELMQDLANFRRDAELAAELAAALEELVDWQNGPPLLGPKWEPGWRGAMEKSAAALKRWEERSAAVDALPDPAT